MVDIFDRFFAVFKAFSGVFSADNLIGSFLIGVLMLFFFFLVLIRIVRVIL